MRSLRKWRVRLVSKRWGFVSALTSMRARVGDFRELAPLDGSVRSESLVFCDDHSQHSCK